MTIAPDGAQSFRGRTLSRRLRDSWRSSVLAPLLMTTACGEVVAPKDQPVPSALAVSSGNLQLYFPGTLLPERLTVQLVDSAGQAVNRSGVRVSWEVLEGGGTITSTSDTTSGGGLARANWRLGNEGVNRARAAAEGLESAEFQARAAPPGPIVFVSNRGTGLVGDEVEGFPGDLFVMNPDGSDVISLFPQFVFQSLSDPDWSPDGTQILYVRRIGRPAGGNPKPLRLGLHIINSNGTEPTQLPRSGHPAYSVYFDDAVWNPFGLRIIATLEADSSADLPPEVEAGSLHFLTNLGTGAMRFLTPLGDARAPSWDFASQRIAFECTDELGFVQICIIRDDRSGFRQLTNSELHNLDPAWSPTGDRLLFARDSAAGGGIWLVNADGSGLQPVLQGKASSPAWSPDGTQFVYTMNVDGQFDIWLFDFATETSTNLTNSRFRDREADWRW